MIEKDLGLKLLLNGKLIPSELSPQVDSYELVIRKDKEHVSTILEFFDNVIERNFQGFSPFFENFNVGNYLYVDYDVDFLGIFASCEKKRVGGYWNLDYLFYENIGLSSFLEQSVFDLDVRSSKLLLSAITKQIEHVINTQSLEMSAFSKMFFGGITLEYLDLKNTDLFIKEELDIIEDLHFELLLNSQNR